MKNCQYAFHFLLSLQYNIYLSVLNNYIPFSKKDGYKQVYSCITIFSYFRHFICFFFLSLYNIVILQFLIFHFIILLFLYFLTYSASIICINSSIVTKIFLGFVPSSGPTMPASASWSMILAARLNPIL